MERDVDSNLTDDMDSISVTVLVFEFRKRYWCLDCCQ